MTEPIVIEFEVAALVEHVFEAWTSRCSSWWPFSHTMSGDEHPEIVVQPFVGGRIPERSSSGEEFDWGEILVWDPPSRLEYWWHIFLDRDRATRVSLTFIGSELGTKVTLVNDGFEVFGDGAAERAGRVGSAWAMITERFGESF